MNFSWLEIMVLFTTLLEFGPLLQARKSIKEKKVDQLSPIMFVMFFLIGALWLTYGISLVNIPLIVGNGIKLFTNGVVLYIYFRCRTTSATVIKK